MVSEALNCREPIPDVVANKPILSLGLSYFLTAFYDLDTERSVSDLAPIPWSAIKAYADAIGCDDFECEQLEYFVRYIDDTYLKKVASKR
jgi:hypothetical protein